MGMGPITSINKISNILASFMIICSMAGVQYAKIMPIKILSIKEISKMEKNTVRVDMSTALTIITTANGNKT
jgi:hypothetical protein